MTLIWRCEINPETFVMEVRAKMAIQQNEEITTRYVDPWEGQPNRQLKIGQNWNFICNCLRCKDPSDLGTYFSAIVCQRCSNYISSNERCESKSSAYIGSAISNNHGYLLPIDCQYIETHWHCINCGEKKCARDIEDLLNEVVKSVESVKQDILVQMEEDFPKVVDSIKSSIDLIQTFVHPNHFLLYQFKKWITELPIPKSSVAPIGKKEPDETINNHDIMHDILTKSVFLELKQKCHLDLLIIIESLDPGFTLNRAGHIKKLARNRMQLSQLNLSVDPENYTDVEHMAQMKIAFSELKLVSDSFKYPETKCIETNECQVM